MEASANLHLQDSLTRVQQDRDNNNKQCQQQSDRVLRVRVAGQHDWYSTATQPVGRNQPSRPPPSHQVSQQTFKVGVAFDVSIEFSFRYFVVPQTSLCGMKVWPGSINLRDCMSVIFSSLQRIVAVASVFMCVCVQASPDAVHIQRVCANYSLASVAGLDDEELASDLQGDDSDSKCLSLLEVEAGVKMKDVLVAPLS